VRWSVQRESREQERRSGSPSYGGLDLSQEGRVSLPNTPAALSRLTLAYHEAALAVCESAIAAVGGRGSLADYDTRRVPSLQQEARARGYLGVCLHTMGEEQQRSLELLRQAVALRRQLVRKATREHDTLSAQLWLANDLSDLGTLLRSLGSEGTVEGEACLREALALGERVENVSIAVKTLVYLINLGGEAHATVGRAEAETFRSRLNQLLVQMGRSPDELHDMPRATRAASRRRSGRRGRRRGQRRCWRTGRLVRARAVLSASVPPRLPLDLVGHGIESCMPHLQEVTCLRVPEGASEHGAGATSGEWSRCPGHCKQ